VADSPDGDREDAPGRGGADPNGEKTAKDRPGEAIERQGAYRERIRGSSWAGILKVKKPFVTRALFRPRSSARFLVNCTSEVLKVGRPRAIRSPFRCTVWL
jgi:hypothetical protein